MHGGESRVDSSGTEARGPELGVDEGHVGDGGGGRPMTGRPRARAASMAAWRRARSMASDTGGVPPSVGVAARVPGARFAVGAEARPSRRRSATTNAPSGTPPSIVPASSNTMQGGTFEPGDGATPRARTEVPSDAA